MEAFDFFEGEAAGSGGEADWGFEPEPELAAPAEGVGDFQDLINKLPGREAAKDKRQRHEDYRVSVVAGQAAGVSEALVLEAGQGRNRLVVASVLLVGLVGFAWWWSRR